MVHFVYVLKSKTRDYLYKGITGNLQRRWDEHNSGINKTTKPYRPFDLLFFEAFDTRALARKREKWLKSGEGRGFLRSRLK